jgi:hypothetical protein
VADVAGLPSLDLVYDEVKYSFDGQAKQLDTINSRVTWLVGTAAGVVIAIASLSARIGALHPPDPILWCLLGGATLVILSALLCLVAMMTRTVHRGVEIATLRQTYLTRDVAEAKRALLDEWQALYDANEAIVVERRLAVRIALALLVTGIGVLIAASAALIVYDFA